MPPQAIVIALATAFQESKLENLDSGDRDSIGLFQQRPSQGWGTPEQLRRPALRGQRVLHVAAQGQGLAAACGSPTRPRPCSAARIPGPTQKWEAKAEVLTRALAGQAPGAVACTLTEPPTSRGPTAAANLAASVKLDWGTVKTVSVANLVGMALSARNQTAGWQYAHWLVAHAERTRRASASDSPAGNGRRKPAPGNP